MIQNSIKKWVSRYSKKQKLILALLGATTLALVALLVWLGVTGRLGIGASTGNDRVYFTVDSKDPNTKIPTQWRNSTARKIVNISEDEFLKISYNQRPTGKNSDYYRPYFDKVEFAWHIPMIPMNKNNICRYNSSGAKANPSCGYFVMQSLDRDKKVLNQLRNQYPAWQYDVVDFPVVRGAKYARAQFFYESANGYEKITWEIDVTKFGVVENTNLKAVTVDSTGRCFPGQGQIAVFNHAEYKTHDRTRPYGHYTLACEIIPAGAYKDLIMIPGAFALVSDGGVYSSSVYSSSVDVGGDGISSIIVNNAEVTVYKERNLKGGSRVIKEDVSNFAGTGWNDEIRSLGVKSTAPAPSPTAQCKLQSGAQSGITIKQGESGRVAITAKDGTLPSKINIEKYSGSTGQNKTSAITASSARDGSKYIITIGVASSTPAVGYRVEITDPSNSCEKVVVPITVTAKCQFTVAPSDITLKSLGTEQVTLSANNATALREVEVFVQHKEEDGSKYLNVAPGIQGSYNVQARAGAEGKQFTVSFKSLQAGCPLATLKVTVAPGDLTISPLSVNDKANIKGKELYTVKGVIDGGKTSVRLEDAELASVAIVYVPNDQSTWKLKITGKNKAGSTKVIVSDTKREARATLNLVCPEGQQPDTSGKCSAPAPAPKQVLKIDEFKADPTELEKGETTTLSWLIKGVTDNTTCSINDEGIENTEIEKGHREKQPVISTVYTLTCNDGDYQVSKSVNVTVRNDELCAPGELAIHAPSGVWEIATLWKGAQTEGLTLNEFYGRGILNYFFNDFGNPYGTGDEGLAEDFTGGRGHWRRNDTGKEHICVVDDGTTPTERVEQELPFKALNMISNPLAVSVPFNSIKFKFSSTGNREMSWNEAKSSGLLKAMFLWDHPTNSYLSFANLERYPGLADYGYHDFSVLDESNTDIAIRRGMWISTRSTDTVKVIFGSS
ncbi:MAG TPA: hypothetical protein PLC05_02290 [bacterium]|nr:hypothetical protein [bacterium]